MKYSNKYILILVFHISCVSALTAQNVNNSSDSILYLTSIDEAFMIDKESKSLLKISPVSNSIINALDNKAFNVEFERKLTKAISISPSMNFNFQKFGNVDATIIRYGVELRYYHKLKSLIRDGKQANNLSSKYIGFSFSDDLKSNSTHIQIYNLSYGVQKRFLNFGYLDYSLNLSRSNWSGSSASNYGLFSRMDIGIGIGKNYKLKEETKCPIFKCYTNRKSAIKINLNSATGITLLDNAGSFFDGRWFAFLNPNIIYERKIANSPLSIENDLSLSITIGKFGLDNDTRISYNVKNQIGFKYYVFQMKDIRNGKSGNNLSGQYSFARMTTLHGKYVAYITSPEDGTQTLGNLKVDEYHIEIGYGIQREVLKNLYFDINLGLRKNVKSVDIDEDKNINFISDIKAGLMF